MTVENAFQKRPPPDEAAIGEKAKAQPGGWVYDIDWPYPADQPVPPEAIRGAWKVDDSGVATDHYMPNDRYRAIARCSRTLKPYMHAGARTNPDQWVVEIDPKGESLFPDIPTHLIRGWWYVDVHGRLSDKFRPNSQWSGEE